MSTRRVLFEADGGPDDSDEDSVVSSAATCSPRELTGAGLQRILTARRLQGMSTQREHLRTRAAVASNGDDLTDPLSDHTEMQEQQDPRGGANAKSSAQTLDAGRVGGPSGGGTVSAAAPWSQSLVDGPDDRAQGLSGGAGGWNLTVARTPQTQALLPLEYNGNNRAGAAPALEDQRGSTGNPGARGWNLTVARTPQAQALLPLEDNGNNRARAAAALEDQRGSTENPGARGNNPTGGTTSAVSRSRAGNFLAPAQETWNGASPRSTRLHQDGWTDRVARGIGYMASIANRRPGGSTRGPGEGDPPRATSSGTPGSTVAPDSVDSAAHRDGAARTRDDRNAQPKPAGQRRERIVEQHPRNAQPEPSRQRRDGIGAEQSENTPSGPAYQPREGERSDPASRHRPTSRSRSLERDFVSEHSRAPRNSRKRERPVDPDRPEPSQFQLKRAIELNRDLYFVSAVAGAMGKNHWDLIRVYKERTVRAEGGGGVRVSWVYEYADVLQSSYLVAICAVHNAVDPGLRRAREEWKTPQAMFDHCIAESDKFLSALAEFVHFLIVSRPAQLGPRYRSGIMVGDQETKRASILRRIFLALEEEFNALSANARRWLRV